MKKYLLILAGVAMLLTIGCKEKSGESAQGNAETEEQEAPKASAAAETSWDYFLVGTWKYSEQTPEGKEPTSYPKGVETFSGNGDYECLTETAGGSKAIIHGTWKLDDKDPYTIWVTQKSIKTANKTKEGESKRKYTVLSLETGKELIYQTGDSYRTAEWLGR